MTLDARREADGGTVSTIAADAPPATAWEGRHLLAAFRAAGEDLYRERQAINALNVFPVPDGDTGTNMDLTVSTALRTIAPLAEMAAPPASDVARAMAKGALLGARGNSGVILSQILRGFSDGIGDRPVMAPRDMARALGAASDLAWRAVLKPVEGTMLSVIRAAGEGAAAAAGDGGDVPAVLAGAMRAAEAALARTPQQLDILRQAGVVDAGGQGVVVLIAGMERYARGAAVSMSSVQERPADVDAHFDEAVDSTHGDDAYGYCTNFMVLGDDIDVVAARERLSAMGESAVIVGDETTLKVHLHTPDPGAALSYGMSLGDLTEIKIDNMQLQARELREAADERATRSREAAPHRPFGRQAVLAVASGRGLEEALRSMGADDVIDGGATMNPSTEQILAAVEATGAAEVILLPNHPNVLMAANQVRELTERAVRVVATRSVPQGIAALSAYNAEAGLEDNARAMAGAMAHVHTLQVTRASRDATINEVEVRSGQAIVLIDGDLVAASDDATDLVVSALADERFADAELITIYTGREATGEHTAALSRLLGERFPDADIEIHDGGQPTYAYTISLE